MKARLCLCLAVLAFAPAAMAGLVSEKIAEKLLDVSGVQTGLEDSFFSAIKPGLDQVKKNGGDDALVNEMSEVAKKFYADNYKWEVIRPIIAKTYAAELSDEDMKAMIAFYETPAGKVAATKLPKATHKGSEAAVATLQSKMPELQAAMMAVVKKHVAAKGK